MQFGVDYDASAGTPSVSLAIVLKFNTGNVQFDPTTGKCEWNVGLVARGKTPSMLGNIMVYKEAGAKLTTDLLLEFQIWGTRFPGLP